MRVVSEIYNPLSREAAQCFSTAQTTVRSIVVEHGIDVYTYPTLCMVNKEPYKRDRWEETLPEYAEVEFVRLAGDFGITALIIALISVAAAVVALSLSQSSSVLPESVGADRENGSSVYTLAGESNQNKLGNVIECAYGRNKMWPSYAARPYTTFKDNDQYQYSLLCLGHGYFDIEQLYVDDTPIQSFADTVYEVIPPGGSVTLIADSVETSTEVQGIELFAENQPDEYTGFTPAYVANTAYTRATRLEVDVVLPGGLYRLDGEGNLQHESIGAQFQYRQVSDSGAMQGGWVSFPDFRKTLRTNTTQRFTIGINVTAGRYVVRAKRTDRKNLDSGASNTLQWQTLRAYFPDRNQYGNVTLIALRTRASNQLNSNSANKISVTATRKLPTYANGTWTAPVATRNPIWAFCDIFRASYGGRLPDSFLKLSELVPLAEQLKTEGCTFDYIFDKSATVWEAARVVAKVCRGLPMLDTSQITLLRDERKLAATALFNQHNIVEGSFSWTLNLVDVAEYDGVEVEYIDADTWQREVVSCLIGEDKGDNMQSHKLIGCTNRSRAFQEGLYLRATQIYLREQIEFKTGQEGLLLRYGDMILVSHDIPSWGTGGFIQEVDGTDIYLQEEVEFQEGIEHKLLLRRRDGTAAGPFAVTAGVSTRHVILAAPLTDDYSWNSANEEPPTFLFGKANYEAKRCSVIGIRPEDTSVAISCVPYDERLYSYGSVATPPRNSPPRVITEPAMPIVKDLRVRQLQGSNDYIQFYWQPTLGAKVYELQYSYTEGVWGPSVYVTEASYTLRVVYGVLFVRLKAVNTAVNSQGGPWLYWKGTVGITINLPTTVSNLQADMQPGYTVFAWQELLGVDSYIVRVFDATANTLLRSSEVSTTSYTYTTDMSEMDNLVGTRLRVTVKGRNIAGESLTAAVVSTTLLQPLAPSGPTLDDDTFFDGGATLDNL